MVVDYQNVKSWFINVFLLSPYFMNYCNFLCINFGHVIKRGSIQDMIGFGLIFQTRSFSYSLFDSLYVKNCSLNLILFSVEFHAKSVSKYSIVLCILNYHQQYCWFLTKEQGFKFSNRPKCCIKGTLMQIWKFHYMFRFM